MTFADVQSQKTIVPGEEYTNKKLCESCGEAFCCGLNACWCAEITLTESQSKDIEAKFNDCLCPACLAEFAD